MPVKTFSFFFFFRDNVIKAASIFRRFHVRPWKSGKACGEGGCMHVALYVTVVYTKKCFHQSNAPLRNMQNTREGGGWGGWGGGEGGRGRGRGRGFTCPVNATRSIAHATPLNRVSTGKGWKTSKVFSILKHVESSPCRWTKKRWK